MTLELASLQRAVDALDKSLTLVSGKKDVETSGDSLSQTLRAGVIQNFEVAYEQCWKMMQRWLRENVSPQEALLPRTRKDLFRVAARFGLIQDPSRWFVYGDARNLTAHIYDEEKAITVFKTAFLFITDAHDLLERLKKADD